MARFLDAQLPAPDIYVHAIVTPEPSLKELTATQLGQHFTVEIVDSANADDIVSVVVQEMTHRGHAFNTSPLHRRLTTVGGPRAVSGTRWCEHAHRGIHHK